MTPRMIVQARLMTEDVQPCSDFGRRVAVHLRSTGKPEEAVLASLGCGNPTALAQLNQGERCSISGQAAALTLSARRVDPIRNHLGHCSEFVCQSCQNCLFDANWVNHAN